LNDTIKAVCKRLAKAGFVAFAPDLYHGQVADTIAGAEKLGGTLDAAYQQAKAEVLEAARFLNEYLGQPETGLAVLAFSLGGFYALQLAAADPEHIRSVVLFYGTEGTMGSDFSASQADYLGHFAEKDVYETQANVDSLEAALRGVGRPVTFYRYPGTGHWFFEPDRTEAYDPEAASLAWERTLEFLKRSSPA
jgi:carboxymethylenebutenolidase